jgi:hypothetical protein
MDLNNINLNMYMELLEYHFSNIDGNLYYNESMNTYEMFSGIGTRKHLNYLTFKELFKNMLEIKDPIILESGIASAGTMSTYLFNEWVRKFGGRFWSVDTNESLVYNHQQNMCPATSLICNDSFAFFNDWVKMNEGKKVDITYLDSYDLDWYNPQPSALHGLYEYIALIPAFKKGSLLLIDDTPINPYWLDSRGDLYTDMVKFYNDNKYLPGKGMHVLNVNNRAEKILHNYQVLYKF